MKNLTLSILTISLFTVPSLTAQSFEEMTIPGVTTTLSGSRSAIFVDVNGDGRDDIYFTNGVVGENNMLYINNGNGTFTEITNDDIVSDGSRSVGASFADVDNDGDLDAMMVTWGYGGQSRKNFFYRNNGDGTFTHDPTVAPNLTYSETATWIDVNNDQYLDLFITNSAANLTNLYFENQGNGTFQQVTNLEITDEFLPSRSVDWVDYDNDGNTDLFITNEGNNTNSLFRNDGNGNFTKITNLAIVQGIRNSMGSAWADVDNDGDFDLVVVNYESGNQLFINDNGIFVEQTGSEITLETVNSFSAVFGDVDNDGDLDLFISNSYNDNHFENSLYLNDGNGNFTKVTSGDLANHTGWTYSAAFGDYNDDGWLDLILANNLNDNQTNSLFRNTGSGNNWIKIRCFGTDSNRSAIGAIVKVKAIINGNEVTQMRKIEASSGYCSQNSLTAHFGLGNATEILSVEIQWPYGTVESYTNLEVNNFYTIEEKTGILSFEEPKKNKFMVIPNPVDTIFIVESGDYNTSLDVLNIVIFDAGGKVVKEIKNLKSGMAIDLSGFYSGTYIYNIQERNRILQSGKIIKK